MLVTLEGIDGSGKTTVWNALGEEFEGTYTREPTDSWYGDAVQRSLEADDADPLAELFLYTADHADHLSRVVRPALSRGDLVVSDRYSDSRYAYQGATLAEHFDSETAPALRDPLTFVREIHRPWTRPPDVTVYFDVDPETAVERSDATNKFERVAFLETVRENYHRLLDDEPGRFVSIDARRSRDTVVQEAIDAIEDVL